MRSFKKIKIAIICNSYPTSKNKGNQIFIKNLVEQFDNDKIEPNVFYNKIFDIWGNANNKKDIFSNIIKYIFFFMGVLKLFLSIKKYKLLNPHGVIFSGFAAVIIKKFYHIPVFLHVHGGDLNLYEQSASYYQKIYDYSLLNSDLIIANSKSIKNKLIKLTKIKKNKIIILSPGVNYDIFHQLTPEEISKYQSIYNLDKHKIVLLFAGNAIKRKGLDILTEALKNLKKNELKEIFLLVCSDGPEINKAIAEIENLNIPDRSFKILNKVNQIDLNIFYNLATAFIFPSRDEPLGLVGIESIAAGTPVIGSNIGGIKEYINENNGFLFNPNKPDELTKIIRGIIKNPKKIDLISSNIDKKKSEHDIKVAVQKISNKILDYI